MDTETPLPLTLPLAEDARSASCAGQRVLLSGPIYGARDAAHARLFDLIRAGRAAELPLDLRDGAVYYVGPAPAPEGPQAHVVGSAGPTTSTRMDAYTPLLIEHGLRLMVGKGRRGPEVKAAMVRHGAVYLAATGVLRPSWRARSWPAGWWPTPTWGRRLSTSCGFRTSPLSSPSTPPGPTCTS